MDKITKLIELFREEENEWFEYLSKGPDDDYREDLRTHAFYWAVRKGLSDKESREFVRTIVYGFRS